jgi:hypothetical protein
MGSKCSKISSAAITPTNEAKKTPLPSRQVGTEEQLKDHHITDEELDTINKHFSKALKTEESKKDKGLGSLNDYQKRLKESTPPGEIPSRSYSPVFGKDLSKNSSERS